MVYEQRPGTVFLCVCRQLVISRQVPDMRVWHNNRAVAWQLHDDCIVLDRMVTYDLSRGDKSDIFED